MMASSLPLFQLYQTDVLILLVGSNPLPNAVAHHATAFLAVLSKRRESRL